MVKFTMKCVLTILKKKKKKRIIYTETHGKLAVLREERNEIDK